MFKITNTPSEKQQIATLNWPDQFGYAPKVEFSIWHTGDAIHIKYEVDEQATKAEQTVLGEPVYMDSCVEFFVKPCADDPHYYNFEWNAAGKLAMACRTSRHDPDPAPLDVLESVKVCPSLGLDPFAEKAVGPWTLEVEIPVSALFRHDVKSLAGKTMYANLYKCGDGLKVPHYTTWQPISTENPDYHRPEFFVPICFE